MQSPSEFHVRCACLPLSPPGNQGGAAVFLALYWPYYTSTSEVKEEEKKYVGGELAGTERADGLYSAASQSLEGTDIHEGGSMLERVHRLAPIERSAARCQMGAAAMWVGLSRRKRQYGCTQDVRPDSPEIEFSFFFLWTAKLM